MEEKFVPVRPGIIVAQSKRLLGLIQLQIQSEISFIIIQTYLYMFLLLDLVHNLVSM